MRLRRLLRIQAEYQGRFAVEGSSSPLAAAASTRLLRLLQDVRASWVRESQGVEAAGLRPFVNRWLATMEAAAAALAQPGADATRLCAELREAGVPLVLFLRGMDDSDAPILAELAGQPLARSA